MSSSSKAPPSQSARPLSPEEETPVRPMDGIEGPPGLGKRKDREGDRDRDFVDIDDEEEDQIPTEMPDPPKAAPETPPVAKKELTLQDILDAMNHGFARQDSNMTTIRQEMGEIQRDTHEAKNLSAKAVTIANEAKESLTTLEKRVAALEAGPPPLNTLKGSDKGLESTKGGKCAILTCWGGGKWRHTHHWWFSQLGRPGGTTGGMEPFREQTPQPSARGDCRDHCPNIPMPAHHCEDPPRPPGSKGDAP